MNALGRYRLRLMRAKGTPAGASQVGLALVELADAVRAYLNTYPDNASISECVAADAAMVAALQKLEALP